MQCNQSVLHVGSRSHFLCRTKQNPHFTAADFAEKLLFLRIAVGFVNEAYLFFGNSHADQFGADIVVNIEGTVIFRGR